MANAIKVQSGRDDTRVALWERDAEHPGGEAYVVAQRAADGKLVRETVTVAKTALVRDKLASGDLVEVRGDSK